MAGELEQVVRKMFSAFETMDVDALMSLVTSDMQGVDEISRKWLRGEGELKDYFNSLQGQVSNVTSDIKDVHETIHGDVGILTCWLEQDYTMGGQKTHVSAPTTCLFRNEGGSWRATLFHSIPLAE